MSEFLSQLQKTVRRALITKHGATHAPNQVPQGVHKSYGRMKRVLLPPPTHQLADLAETIRARRSYDGGSESGFLTREQCGTLFGVALGKDPGSGRRNYPSGGALYPIETYLIGRIENHEPAVFHYNPTEHALETLWPLPSSFILKDLAPRQEDLLLSSLIIFTSVWDRSSAKYGDLAYSHALLEAGHMSQNILLVATALGIGARAYAGFNDARIESLLDIRAEEEQPVHSITISL